MLVRWYGPSEPYRRGMAGPWTHGADPGPGDSDGPGSPLEAAAGSPGRSPGLRASARRARPGRPGRPPGRLRVGDARSQVRSPPPRGRAGSGCRRGQLGPSESGPSVTVLLWHARGRSVAGSTPAAAWPPRRPAAPARPEGASGRRVGRLQGFELPVTVGGARWAGEGQKGAASSGLILTTLFDQRGWVAVVVFCRGERGGGGGLRGRGPGRGGLQLHELKRTGQLKNKRSLTA
jgi:hypothetical protein